MLRYWTAGESHGKALVALVDGGFATFDERSGAVERVPVPEGVGTIGRPWFHADGRTVAPTDTGVCVYDRALVPQGCLAGEWLFVLGLQLCKEKQLHLR